MPISIDPRGDQGMHIDHPTVLADLDHPHAATPPVVGYLNKVGVLTAPLLPRPRFSMRAEPGSHHRICWRPNSVVAQLSQL